MKTVTNSNVHKLNRRKNRDCEINLLVSKTEKRKFALKTHQMFSVHTTPEEFKNATTTDHFGFVFEEQSVREITQLSFS